MLVVLVESIISSLKPNQHIEVLKKYIHCTCNEEVEPLLVDSQGLTVTEYFLKEDKFSLAQA